MRTFVVQIRPKRRLDYPETWLVRLSTEESVEIDQRIRRLFEGKKIKDFLVVEVPETDSYGTIDAVLSEIETGHRTRTF